MRNSQNQYIDPSNAATYAQNNNVQVSQADSFLENNLGCIVPPVLDVGCGDGAVTYRLAVSAKLENCIDGMDISHDRITLAKKTYGHAVGFFVADIVHAPSIKNAYYNTVVSFNALHHIPETLQLNALLNMRHALKDEGVALFMMPGDSNGKLHQTFQSVANLDHWSPWFHDFEMSRVRTYQSPNYYKVQCHKAGFYATEAHSSVKLSSLNFAEMSGFLSGWLPHLAHLKSKGVSEEKRQQFLSEIVSLYFSYSKTDKRGYVEIMIQHNHVLAFATKQGFFKHGGNAKGVLNETQFKPHL